MVTLLGFFFILGNIGLLIIYMPDLVGPVSSPAEGARDHEVLTRRGRLGTDMAVL